MKVSRTPNSFDPSVVSPTNLRGLPSTPGRRCLAGALSALLFALLLTGCVTTRTVDKTVLAPDVKKATLDDLLKRMADQYAAVNNLTLTVEITATHGGSRQGEVKQYPSFPGYILLRKPEDLRLIMQLPLVRSSALDMVANGRTFKLQISEPKCSVRMGSEQVSKPSTNVLENLRPPVIRDALQIPPVGSDEYVTLTEHSRLIAPAHGHKEAVEEPDYDISVLDKKAGEANGHVLARARVIHISRVTLLPYQQDLYDDQGRVSETIAFSKFQRYGAVDYPMSIFITRPIDEYTLQIDISKVRLNQTMDDPLQFELQVPPGCAEQQM